MDMVCWLVVCWAGQSTAWRDVTCLMHTHIDKATCPKRYPHCASDHNQICPLSCNLINSPLFDESASLVRHPYISIINLPPWMNPPARSMGAATDVGGKHLRSRQTADGAGTPQLSFFFLAVSLLWLEL